MTTNFFLVTAAACCVIAAIPAATPVAMVALFLLRNV